MGSYNMKSINRKLANSKRFQRDAIGTSSVRFGFWRAGPTVFFRGLRQSLPGASGTIGDRQPVAGRGGPADACRAIVQSGQFSRVAGDLSSTGPAAGDVVDTGWPRPEAGDQLPGPVEPDPGGEPQPGRGDQTLLGVAEGVADGIVKRA